MSKKQKHLPGLLASAKGMENSIIPVAQISDRCVGKPVNRNTIGY